MHPLPWVVIPRRLFSPLELEIFCNSKLEIQERVPRREDEWLKPRWFSQVGKGNKDDTET